MNNAEYHKMINGEVYNFRDSYLQKLRNDTFELNHVSNTSNSLRLNERLLPHVSKKANILKPFSVSYGLHIHMDEGSFINTGATIIDNAKIIIGRDTMIGPNVQLLTAHHAIDTSLRVAGYEIARPIKIGNGCWFGGGVIVIGGVTIGNECIIAAGTVVTKDVPDGMVARGNPMKILRKPSKDW